jgi:hypothetical protein
MRILDIVAVGSDYVDRDPDGSEQRYPQWIEYRAFGDDWDHRVRLGFKVSTIYGRERQCVIVWIDDKSSAVFCGADDFERSGEVVSEIKIPGNAGGLVICRYQEDAIPDRYCGLPVVGLPTRIQGPGVHSAWAVVANIADHRTIVMLAALRRLERNQFGQPNQPLQLTGRQLLFSERSYLSRPPGS